VSVLKPIMKTTICRTANVVCISDFTKVILPVIIFLPLTGSDTHTYMAYLIGAVIMTLSFVEGHSSIASLFKCDILCLCRVAWFLCICRAFCYLQCRSGQLCHNAFLNSTDGRSIANVIIPQENCKEKIQQWSSGRRELGTWGEGGGKIHWRWWMSGMQSATVVALLMYVSFYCLKSAQPYIARNTTQQWLQVHLCKICPSVCTLMIAFLDRLSPKLTQMLKPSEVKKWVHWGHLNIAPPVLLFCPKTPILGHLLLTKPLGIQASIFRVCPKPG